MVCANWPPVTNRIFVILLSCLLVPAMGCGARKDVAESIEGLVATSAEIDIPVMLHSESSSPGHLPLPGAFIQLYSDSQCTIEIRNASATTDKNGRYRITIDSQPGAALSECYLVVYYNKKKVYTHEIKFGRFASYHNNIILLPKDK